jgi:4'-phosphopantetheinyl transferase
MPAAEINVRPPKKIWDTAPEHSPLTAEDVFVWRVPVVQPDRELARFSAFLSADEAARVARFHFEPDRRRAIVSRGALRVVLGRELSEPPGRIQFSYGPQGKPELSAQFIAADLRFNVSHSHEEILIALARGRAVGVDIEHFRPGIHDEEIGSRYFTSGECAALRSLAPSRRAAGFFAYWTCKEALIKAKGGGLSIPLDTFEVEVDLEIENVPLRILSGAGLDETWSIRRLPAPDGYAAAVAAAEDDWSIRCWQWQA